MLVSAATAYSVLVCIIESCLFFRLGSGGVVLLVGARLSGARLLDVDTEFVGMVHGQPMIEAPFSGKFSRDLVIRLLHHFLIRVMGEIVVGKTWKLSSAASVDAEVGEVFLVHFGGVGHECCRGGTKRCEMLVIGVWVSYSIDVKVVD